jgi:hypothetical protein
MPQECGGSAVAGEDDVVVEGDSDGRGGEGDEATSIAKLSHGDEGELLEGRDNVHVAGGEGKGR